MIGVITTPSVSVAPLDGEAAEQARAPKADALGSSAASTLDALIQSGAVRVGAMSDAEREAELAAQGASWVRGEMALGSDADEAAYRAEQEGAIPDGGVPDGTDLGAPPNRVDISRSPTVRAMLEDQRRAKELAALADDDNPIPAHLDKRKGSLRIAPQPASSLQGETA